MDPGSGKEGPDLPSHAQHLSQPSPNKDLVPQKTQPMVGQILGLVSGRPLLCMGLGLCCAMFGELHFGAVLKLNSCAWGTGWFTPHLPI